MVTQEDRPLSVVRDGRRLIENVVQREAVFLSQRHVQPRHQREVEAHVALVTLSEVGHGILGPLVRFGEQHPILVVRVHVGAQLAQERVRLRQVLAIGAVALVQVRDGIEPQPVDAKVQPEVERLRDLGADPGVVEVQVGLMVVEAVPVVGVGFLVERPVRAFEVLEDDAHFAIAIGRVAPDVIVARGAARRSAARALEPRVLVAGVVAHELGDDAQAAGVGLADERLDVTQRAVIGVDAGVVGDVVPVVATRRRVERQQPDRGDAQVLEVVEPACQPGKIADPVAVRNRQTSARGARR